MTDLGVFQPAPPHAAPPAGRPSSDIPLWVLLVAVVVMLALAAAVTFVLTADGHARAKHSYPDEWDSRIAPYAKIAERQRGLFFRHPVAVRFLPAAEFEKTVTSEEKELSKEDRAEIEQVTGLMRALGLISGDLDLFDASNDLSGAGTLAYYAFEDKRITIRGETVTPAVRETLVHELTHALQDQHFGIGERFEKLAKSAKDDESTSEASVLRAVVEGDASRMETVYRRSLSAKERKALDAGRQGEVDHASRRIKQVPKVMVTMMTSPYSLGEALVQAVAADGGNAEVDKLFRRTPTHESSLLDPFRVLAGDNGATEVDVPKLQEGEKSFGSGEFGVLTWYFMLAERLPLLDALGAVDGWGGDAYVAFERDGDSCARLDYVGDRAGDSARMFSALQRWIGAGPGSSASVRRTGNTVRFESCDPGTAIKAGKDASADALDLALIRTYLGLDLLRAGVPQKASRCLAQGLVRAFPLSRLIDPGFGNAGDSEARERVRQLAPGCR